MVLASGPGSASRKAIGTGVFFGMLAAVFIGIQLIPFFFITIYKAKNRLQAKKGNKEQKAIAQQQ